VVGIQGCASLSEKECLNADWRTIGYEDGAQGRVSARIADHRKSCAKHGIAPDLAAYNQGRSEGLKQYCVPGNGFRLGLNGHSYNAVCPAGSEREFVAAYRGGKKIHEVKQQIRRLDEILNVNQSELYSLNELVRQKEAELITKGTSWERRAALLVEMRELEKDINMVENEILDIEAALSQENDRLLSLKQVSTYW
jgi:hypothetical protein